MCAFEKDFLWSTCIYIAECNFLFGFTRMLFSCPLAYLLWLFYDHLPCYCYVVSSPAERRWPVCSSWGADTVGACKVQDWIYTCVGRLLTFLVQSLSLSLCLIPLISTCAVKPIRAVPWPSVGLSEKFCAKIVTHMLSHFCLPEQTHS